MTDFLDFDSIKPAMSAGTKRALLQQLASLAGHRLGIAPAAILETLNEREALGPTGLGQGVAIP
ncbi:MAG TPA: PTS sugar transporter subunit IIA, partial [Sphingomicrobium sp.]|nr:PTS sugar transporter subunit IIA [Sphingomicrobium sp.]